MCGIVCECVSSRNDPSLVEASVHESRWDAACSLAAERGPDAQRHISFPFGRFFGAVLHLRGPLVTQPVVNTSGDVLVYNGEIFSLEGKKRSALDDGLSEEKKRSVLNDGLSWDEKKRSVLNDGLSQGSSLGASLGSSLDSSLDSSLRSSLDSSLDPPTSLSSLNDTQWFFTQLVAAKGNADAIAALLASIAGPYAFIYYSAAARRLFFARDYLGRRSLQIHRSHGCLLIASIVPEGHDVSPDGLYSVDPAQLDEPPAFVPHTRSLSLISSLDRIPAHLETSLFETATSELYRCLTQSLQRRLWVPDDHVPGTPRAAVLFSGGVDCTCIAALCHENIPLCEPIELVNVAFENPRLTSLHASPAKLPHADYASLAPDRHTGIAAYKELCARYPERQWRFITVDVPYAELLAHKPKIIDLLHPGNMTQIDLSIGIAFYFASRALGTCDNAVYQAQSRVLFSGLGADELFGGYSRHRRAYERGAEHMLFDELALDLARLPQRNLGRDDRLTSCHAREVRYPFLDEALVDWARRQNIWLKCNFDLADGTKLLVRRLVDSLGLLGAAAERKRAIHFGSRSAKMEPGSSKMKGHHKID